MKKINPAIADLRTKIGVLVRNMCQCHAVKCLGCDAYTDKFMWLIEAEQKQAFDLGFQVKKPDIYKVKDTVKCPLCNVRHYPQCEEVRIKKAVRKEQQISAKELDKAQRIFCRETEAQVKKAVREERKRIISMLHAYREENPEAPLTVAGVIQIIEII